MNKIITIFLMILCQICYSQILKDSISTKETISLKWKLAEGDTLKYKTLMQNIESKTEGISSFQKLFENSYFKDKLKKQIKNTNLVTYLTNSEYFDNVIEVEMIGEEKNKKKTKKKKNSDIFETMLVGTQLRGSILKSGKVYSFWLKRGQLNLIAMFFELPNKPISVGETWELKDVSFIGNDQNFKCQEAEKINRVELKEIKYTENDIIAVLNYNIREFVKGEFGTDNNPFENTPISDYAEELTKKRIITMDYSFKAIAEFSVNQGKWLSYDGVISFSSNGYMGNNSTVQNYALEEIE